MSRVPTHPLVGPVASRLELVEEIVSCKACDLHDRYSGPVPFFGPVPADVAVLGEAPGYNEDIQGRPFVGQAGDVIRGALKEIDIDPESVTWINTVSCFPKGTPTPTHVAACAPLKQKQLELIDPKWLLILGKVALKSIRSDLEIGRARGRPFLVGGAVGFAAYHPAAALRNRVMDKALREDLAVWRKMYDAGRDHWYESISESCFHCANPVFEFDEVGIGACQIHAG